MLLIVRLTHIDGKLPNLALMKLASWHRQRGDTIHFTRSVEPELFEARNYDRVYASTIFTMSARRIKCLLDNFPDAIIGGTGSGNTKTVEQVVGDNAPDDYDFSLYPNFDASIGFLQRGCRLKCSFCVVPKKEGRPRAVARVHDIWRGDPYPKHLHLLDNDFFGVPEWERNISDIREGGFKVCFSQGINIRLVSHEAARALATVDYRDNKFKKRRIYTAWDNKKDEKIFFRGVDRLERAGVPPHHIMAYMLIGYDPNETMDDILWRYVRMTNRGVMPYPMVYDPKRQDLKAFQRWVIRGYSRVMSWKDYRDPRKPKDLE